LGSYKSVFFHLISASSVLNRVVFCFYCAHLIYNNSEATVQTRRSIIKIKKSRWRFPAPASANSRFL
jgi:hypothetical protein